MIFLQYDLLWLINNKRNLQTSNENKYVSIQEFYLDIWKWLLNNDKPCACVRQNGIQYYVHIYNECVKFVHHFLVYILYTWSLKTLIEKP